MSTQSHEVSVIRSDRSRIVTRQQCARKRYLTYHYGGTGLEKPGSKYEAAFGSIIHEALAVCVLKAGYDDVEVRKCLDKLEASIMITYGELPPAQLKHMIKEQRALLVFLVYGWCKNRLPIILNNYHIVQVESEESVIFQPIDYLPANFASYQRPLELPLRRDVLLRGKFDDSQYIMDFKTTSDASEDWNVALDNSLQSNLYIEGSQELLKATGSDSYIAGMFYEGLVKGHRQVDNARSSPFNGYTIQYGSFLYGWQTKTGEVSSQYRTGSQRVFLPDEGVKDGATNITSLYEWIARYHDWENYFPTTVPWRSLDTGLTTAQVIVQENAYQNNLELYQSVPVNSPERSTYEGVLFEQNLEMCYKYGKRHACQFVEICHQKIGRDEISRLYTERVDHHKETV